MDNKTNVISISEMIVEVYKGKFLVLIFTSMLVIMSVYISWSRDTEYIVDTSIKITVNDFNADKYFAFQEIDSSEILRQLNSNNYINFVLENSGLASKEVEDEFKKSLSLVFDYNSQEDTSNIIGISFKTASSDDGLKLLSTFVEQSEKYILDYYQKITHDVIETKRKNILFEIDLIDSEMKVFEEELLDQEMYIAASSRLINDTQEIINPVWLNLTNSLQTLKVEKERRLISLGNIDSINEFYSSNGVSINIFTEPYADQVDSPSLAKSLILNAFLGFFISVTFVLANRYLIKEVKQKVKNV